MNIAKLMPIARAIGLLSKDTSTKVGALIVGPAGEIRSSGWNGAPRGCSADEDHRSERPEKYFWAAHAEANAIAQAARVGTPLEGCSILVTHYPCMECGKLIVQAGIKHVVVPAPDAEFCGRWSEHIRRADQLFAECGVSVELVE